MDMKTSKRFLNKLSLPKSIGFIIDSIKCISSGESLFLHTILYQPMIKKILCWNKSEFFA